MNNVKIAQPLLYDEDTQEQFNIVYRSWFLPNGPYVAVTKTQQKFLQALRKGYDDGTISRSEALMGELYFLLSGWQFIDDTSRQKRIKTVSAEVLETLRGKKN